MKIEEKILDILYNNFNTYISGQKISERLNISRMSVSNYIKKLKNRGYDISSSTNKGYILNKLSNIISKESIKYLLKNKDINIYIHDSLDSTNNKSKEYISDKDTKNLIIIAKKQTDGKGRYGKFFYSPDNTGIYMSLIVSPNLDIKNSSYIIMATAISVCDAIKEISNISTKIKWINDIFLNGKKIGGILTEAFSNFETGKIQKVIIGIGLNISTKYFPEDIQNIAGSLNISINKNILIAKIIDNILSILENFNLKDTILKYRSLSMVLESEISFILNNKKIYGIAKDITNTGELIVISEDNRIYTLKSEEISIEINQKIYE
ncbi:MAG: biotin--[acetyl-CoA-carboxylase] ligase [Oscillospiraceae bacterium]|nr:biotin--[acetyl-CoA-carboxylase] ligase [Oscillospiraceae bacterium]